MADHPHKKTWDEEIADIFPDNEGDEKDVVLFICCFGNIAPVMHVSLIIWPL